MPCPLTFILQMHNMSRSALFGFSQFLIFTMSSLITVAQNTDMWVERGESVGISLLLLINPFSTNVPLLYPWKHQKTFGLITWITRFITKQKFTYFFLWYLNQNVLIKHSGKKTLSENPHLVKWIDSSKEAIIWDLQFVIIRWDHPRESRKVSER